MEKRNFTIFNTNTHSTCLHIYDNKKKIILFFKVKVETFSARNNWYIKFGIQVIHKKYIDPY